MFIIEKSTHGFERRDDALFALVFEGIDGRPHGLRVHRFLLGRHQACVDADFGVREMEGRPEILGTGLRIRPLLECREFGDAIARDPECRSRILDPHIDRVSEVLFPDRENEVHPHLEIDEDLRCAKPLEHRTQIVPRVSRLAEKIEPLLPLSDDRLPVDPWQRPEAGTDPLPLLVGRRKDDHIRLGIVPPMHRRLMRHKRRVHAKLGCRARVHPKKKTASFDPCTWASSRDPLEEDRRKTDEHERHTLAGARGAHRVSHMSPDDLADEVALFQACGAPDGAEIGWRNGCAKRAGVLCRHRRATGILACRGSSQRRNRPRGAA